MGLLLNSLDTGYGEEGRRELRRIKLANRVINDDLLFQEKLSQLSCHMFFLHFAHKTQPKAPELGQRTRT